MLAIPTLNALSRTGSILALIGVVAAQQQTVSAPSCQLDTWNWTTNSLNQTVCQQAGLALSACTTGFVSIPALNAPVNQHEYTGPNVSTGDAGDLCKCNSVFYSLISACGGCQGGLWEPYSQWVAGCTNTSAMGTWPSQQIGFPKNSSIPAWAFQPIDSNGLFDNTTAFAFFQSNKSEVSSLPGPTASASQSGAGPTASGGASSGSSSNAGAIAGGVVGGVVGAALLVALAWFLIRRRRQRVAPSAAFMPEHENGAAAPAFVSDAPFLSNTTPRKFYDPSDPSTFPDAGAGANESIVGTSTSPGPTINTTYQPGHKTISSWGSNDQSGDYRGLPEV